MMRCFQVLGSQRGGGTHHVNVRMSLLIRFTVYTRFSCHCRSKCRSFPAKQSRKGRAARRSLATPTQCDDARRITRSSSPTKSRRLVKGANTVAAHSVSPHTSKGPPSHSSTPSLHVLCCVQIGASAKAAHQLGMPHLRPGCCSALECCSASRPWNSCGPCPIPGRRTSTTATTTSEYNLYVDYRNYNL